MGTETEGKDGTTYANSDSSAEKAQQNDSNTPAPKLPLPAAAKAIVARVETVLNLQGAPPGDGGIGGSRDEKKEFREDAKIWNYYLEEAERKAKEQADLWNTGLDSLLIFAGLFAGIVSSFVIDARSDLQTDSDQRLLTQIREVLAQGSVNPPERISVASNWTSGLWVLSLYTTLFSAIMGVLAKAWLAKFIPATTRRESKDAYNRYKLDRQSERWHLKEVLILVPLLVQIAAFLFLVGLVLQSHADNPTIGRTLLAFCISGAAIYFVMTCIPFIVPSSPFNTPLSELCDGLFSRKKEEEGSPSAPFKRDMNEGLGEIFYTKLIKSPKPAHVDEAFLEVALPVFHEKWTEELCKKDAPQVLLTRLRQRATARTDDALERDETLCNHLLALLKFVNHYEKKLTGEKDLAKVQAQYQTLDTVLRTSLEPGNPLHRWNELPEALRPLLFGLRAQVIMLLNMKDLPKSPPRPGIPDTPTDFNMNELPDRPWDMAFQEIRSTHRLHFVLGACRGLAEGPPILKTISSFVLCLCLAKATLSASETGRTSEWAASLTPTERANVDALASRYLTRLYEVAVKGWEDVAADALSDMCSVKVPLEETDLTQPHARLLRSLIVSLSQPQHALRIHAIKMLKHVSSPSPNLFNGIIDASIKSIASMTVYDDQDVRDDGFDLLSELAKADEKMCGQIKEALVSSIQSGLAKYEDQPRIRTITFIQTLSIVSGGPLHSAVNEVIPNLVEVALDESSPDDVRLPAMRLVQKLWNNGFKEVKDGLLNYLSLGLDGSEFNRRYNFLVALKDLQNRKEYKTGVERPPYTFPWLFPTEFVEAVVKFESMFEKIVKVSIHDEDRSIQVAGQELLKQLANDDRFVWDLKIDALKWIETATVLPSYRWRVRHNGVLVLETFVKRLETENKDLLKKLIELALKDDDNDVRSAALNLISSICKDCGLSDEGFEYIRDTILSYDALPVDESSENSEPPPVPGDAIIREPYSSICNSWIPLICTVSKQVAFPDGIPIIIRILIRGETNETRKQVVDFLTSEETIKPEDLDVFVNAVPRNLELAPGKRDGWEETAKWVRLLVALLGHGKFEEPVKKALGSVVKNLEDAIKGNVIEEPEPKEEPAAKDPDSSSTSSASDHNSEETHPENTYMAESSLSLPMRKYLVGLNWLERRYWVDVLANAAGHFPKQLAEAPGIIIQMAIHDPDSDVRNSCLQSMIVLAKHVHSCKLICTEVAPHVATLLEDRDWNVRFSLAQFLGALAKSPDITLPEDIVAKLVNQAMEDRDYDCRSEFVNSMAILASVEGEGGQGSGKYAAAMNQAIHTHFEKGLRDDSWKVRQSWVKLVGPQVKDADFFGINKILDAAIKDTDPDVQADALRWLQEFLKDAKLRDSMASTIGKSLASAFKDPNLCDTAVAALKKLTLPGSMEGKPSADAESDAPDSHKTWIQIILLLGRNPEFQAVPKLVEMVVKDVPWDFDSLDPLFQKVKLPEPIQNVLPRCIESALKSDVSYEVRSAAVSLLRRLIENGDYHGDLLNKANDGTIVTRLADICIKDDDGDLRKETLRLLKSIFDNQRFQDAIKASLSKVIEAAMKDPESAKYRPNAIEAIRSLTDGNADDQYDRFKEIVSPSISPLMKMTLLVTDKDHENLRKQAEDILLDNLTASTTETKLNRDVLTMIPTMIPTITVEGKGIALQLAEGLVISDDTAASIAHALAPILRNASSFARATAIELLSRIYSRHRQSKPRLIESAIPEIITLALDDKDDVGGIRATAIRLLVALSGASADTKDSEHNSTLSYSTSGPVLKQITPLATKFMTLLDNENLRPSVVELLSLMSTEAAVRKTISLQIITLAFGPESLALVGHAELLVRLISDGRFADEPTDHVMLFLASAMVTRPKLAPQRYQILTALWCRYGSKALAYDADAKFLKNKELVDWFTFALFGRHATIHEVPTWTARSGIWLPVTVVPPTPEPTPLAASEL